jgi:uncharacterized protein
LVSATNHKFSAAQYLADFPLEYVEEIHLAGHVVETDDHGARLLIDSHDRKVCDAVWVLYESIISKTGAIATLIEWDNDVPEWPVLESEALAADCILDRYSSSKLCHAV